MAISTSLNLVQIVPSLHSGGVERGCVDVARECVRRGGNSVVISAGGPLVAELEAVGATHITLPVHSKHPLTMMRNVSRITQAIRASRADIVHVRSRAPAWSAYYAAAKAGVPMVTTFHGVYGASGAMKKSYNRIMLKGEKTIVASRYVRSHIIDTYGKRYEPMLELIPRGIDPAEFLDNPRCNDDNMGVLRLKHQATPGQKVILLPGRLTRWKGQHILIKALARMRQKTGWVALMVGDNTKEPHYAEELKLLAKREGIADRMRWIPHTSDIACFYRIADVTVSASIEPEAFGRVTAEAQMSGCPVIATAHGGSLDTVVHGRTGLLTPPNDPDALCDALNYALFMPDDERERLVDTARTRVTEHFSLAAMLNSTFTLYEKILRANH